MNKPAAGGAPGHRAGGLAPAGRQPGGDATSSSRMLAQAAADSGAVTVQVLPFESGAHAAAGDGSLALLQFDRGAGSGAGAPGRHRRRGVPGRPGRPRRLRGGVRPAAGVRAQPRAVRAAAAGPGGRLTPLIAGASAARTRGGSTGSACGLHDPPRARRVPAPAARRPLPMTRIRARDELCAQHPSPPSLSRAVRAARRGADSPGGHRRSPPRSW